VEEVSDEELRYQSMNGFRQGPIDQEVYGRFMSMHTQTHQFINQEGRTNDKLHSQLRGYLDTQFEKLNENICR
jgi:hypothetical protein